MDMDCLKALFEKKTAIITAEEGELIGGFGSEIARLCAEHRAAAPLCTIGLPNRFITHGSMDQLLSECGLMPEQIGERVKAALEAKKNG